MEVTYDGFSSPFISIGRKIANLGLQGILVFDDPAFFESFPLTNFRALFTHDILESG